ncbi:RnfABCDGE type electron transport complex subunit D [Parasporobacterium paucivorans]|uniref:Ion-translocating oxidoreductase complex subunit D n=1 Tax=Parasporobacterium paucivorans DSM 15970 TaxID=1122934 RepID=A0A1M6ADB9_9FIRM|nr:RnfABCDGE type electron transport complex subunit D [Parasporobacterium paucivorans]SHI34401.1 electron transport complex protein RnfD [Parasporobacterium paucivorans DSM 15970]
MNALLKVSSNPHIRDKSSTTGIMLDVIIALMPATIFGIYNFGFRALILTLVCVVVCAAVEYVYQTLMKQEVTTKDLSAVLTGLLIAMNLPPELPFWMAVLGCIFAIVVVKQLFGGIGQNFMNPALAARNFMVISFAGSMTRFTLDGMTTATPLAILKTGGTVNVMDMFIGNIAGTIGETSALALLIGGIYLLAKRIIDIRIPFFYLLTVAVFVSIYSITAKGGFDPAFLAAHLCGGGLMLGAFFMATDYVTSPITPNGRIIYAVIIGLLTCIFRLFGGTAEGVSFAIIISNLLVPLIERWTVPKSFGKGAEKA